MEESKEIDKLEYLDMMFDEIEKLLTDDSVKQKLDELREFLFSFLDEFYEEES